MLVQDRGMDGRGRLRTAGDGCGRPGMLKDGRGRWGTAGDGTSDVS